MNLPNKLTILRMALVPVFIACFYIPVDWSDIAAAVIFVAAYITDIMDGRYARKHGLVTNFGKLMDPMADKLLTSAAIIMLTADGRCNAIACFIIIGREFIISGFRLIAVNNGVVIGANWLGKVKTITQCVAVVLMLFATELRQVLGFPMDAIVLWISVGFAVWSCADYIIKNRKAVSFD